MNRWTMMILGAVAMLGAPGCDKDESFVTADQVEAEISGAVNEAIPKCTPGFARDCPCPMGALGVQTCAADGKSYSACSDCWAPLPPSGSSSSSGGGAGMLNVQQIDCTQAPYSATAAYPGKTPAELATVRVIGHLAMAKYPFAPVTAYAIADEKVIFENCAAYDYVLFVLP